MCERERKSVCVRERKRGRKSVFERDRDDLQITCVCMLSFASFWTSECVRVCGWVREREYRLWHETSLMYFCPHKTCFVSPFSTTIGGV